MTYPRKSTIAATNYYNPACMDCRAGQPHMHKDGMWRIPSDSRMLFFHRVNLVLENCTCEWGTVRSKCPEREMKECKHIGRAYEAVADQRAEDAEVEEAAEEYGWGRPVTIETIGLELFEEPWGRSPFLSLVCGECGCINEPGLSYCAGCEALVAA